VYSSIPGHYRENFNNPEDTSGSFLLMNTQTANRVAVVTGASSGIGKEVARALAAQGWRIIALGRDAARSAAALADIRAAATTGRVDMIRADLALLADAARAAREVAALTDRIDVLVNNAGGIAKQKVVTTEGFEANFSGNHLGPFLLTNRLLPLLRRAASDTPKDSVRVLNTTSDASEMVPGMDWNDLQGLVSFNSGLAYCRAKLANVLFMRGLASRLEQDGIVAHAVHPGAVDSNFISYADEGTQARFKTYKPRTVAEGADTLIWLATEESGMSTGGYFHDRKLRTPNPFAADAANADRLWHESEKLIASAGV
jgi:NAD(P)-dependent dehydrogenase (short-subunit alcohol dehydrogenase family)